MKDLWQTLVAALCGMVIGGLVVFQIQPTFWSVSGGALVGFIAGFILYNPKEAWQIFWQGIQNEELMLKLFGNAWETVKILSGLLLIPVAISIAAYNKYELGLGDVIAGGIIACVILYLLTAAIFGAVNDDEISWLKNAKSNSAVYVGVKDSDDSFITTFCFSLLSLATIFIVVIVFAMLALCLIFAIVDVFVKTAFLPARLSSGLSAAVGVVIFSISHNWLIAGGITTGLAVVLFAASLQASRFEIADQWLRAKIKFLAN